jgi:phospholipid/cholesterol/gamma-HCH transport system substrate-binding protein
MNEKSIQVIVGIFMAFGIFSVTYIAIQLGDINLLSNDRYDVVARFTSVSGLNEGAFVEAAGVRVGSVKSIEFDPEDYLAIVTLSINKNVPIQEDAIASVRTSGIIGDKFIKISPGGMDPIQPGDEILETEPSISLEELISKYIFESGDD